MCVCFLIFIISFGYKISCRVWKKNLKVRLVFLSPYMGEKFVTLSRYFTEEREIEKWRQKIDLIDVFGG